jgi:hypothetical protein
MTALAYVNDRHGQDEVVPVGFPVEQTYGPQHSRITRALQLSSTDITLERMPDDGDNRFMWLAFSLPGTSEEIKALGEFEFSDEMTGETTIRFKHLFPDVRDKLERYLQVHHTA